MIVFSDGERSMGLAVTAIHDIVEDLLKVEMGPSAPGVMGTAVIAGRSTEVVDINHYLRAAAGDWFAAREDDGGRRVLLVDDSAFFLGLVAPPCAPPGSRWRRPGTARRRWTGWSGESATT